MCYFFSNSTTAANGTREGRTEAPAICPCVSTPDWQAFPNQCNRGYLKVLLGKDGSRLEASSFNVQRLLFESEHAVKSTEIKNKSSLFTYPGCRGKVLSKKNVTLHSRRRIIISNYTIPMSLSNVNLLSPSTGHPGFRSLDSD